MSGLAAILAGHAPPGIYQWHGAFDVADVCHTVEHAGWGFAHVDGWVEGGTKAEFLDAVGTALAFPDYYGHNFDAMADCLYDVGEGTDGVVLLWDGWSTLARGDEKAFSVALSVLGSRVNSDRGPRFTVLLRGEGPHVSGVASLD